MKLFHFVEQLRKYVGRYYQKEEGVRVKRYNNQVRNVPSEIKHLVETKDDEEHQGKDPEKRFCKPCYPHFFLPEVNR
jgi:hypothetical protein